jgi:hypothetical protein
VNATDPPAVGGLDLRCQRRRVLQAIPLRSIYDLGLPIRLHPHHLRAELTQRIDEMPESVVFEVFGRVKQALDGALQRLRLQIR